MWPCLPKSWYSVPILEAAFLEPPLRFEHMATAVAGPAAERGPVPDHGPAATVGHGARHGARGRDMATARIPGGIWTWRHTALVLVVVLAPVLALGLPRSEQGRVDTIARFDGIVMSPALLVSAIACYAAWRLNPRPGLGWLSFVVTLFGLQGLMLIAAQIMRYPETLEELWTLAADLILSIVVVIATLLSGRTRVHPDPAAAGFVVGILIAIPRMVWVATGPELGQGLPRTAVAVPFALAITTTVVIYLRGSSLPTWARLRLAAAVPLIGGAHLVLYLTDSWPGHAITIAGDVLGSVLVLTTSLALLLIEVRVDETRRSDLNDELEGAKQGLRTHRAQFHEINATIAGISSASRLLHSPQPITGRRRHVLEEMVLAELARLERLMAETTGQAPELCTVDLDDTIRTLVTSHEARGRTVHWTPSGEHVTGQPDAIAEVLNILLDNAAKHGNAAAEVGVRRTPDAVEIVVSDDGPGVHESVRPHLFTWEARGPRSKGQGIGLHTAHELMRRQGGYLRLLDDRRGGATFILGLPAGDGQAPNGADRGAS